MANYLPATTNLGLILPVPGSDFDDWGDTLNTAFITIDTLIGGPVTLDRINIDGTLNMNSSALINATKLGLVSTASTLIGTNFITSVNGDLYWNNGAATPVRITAGSTINTTGLLTNVWKTATISGSTTIHPADGYTLFLVNSSAGAATANLPPASAVPAGTYYYFNDYTGSATTHAVTLVPNGADSLNGVNSNFSLISPYGSMFAVSDGLSNWQVSTLFTNTVDISGNMSVAGTVTGILTVSANTAFNNTTTFGSQVGFADATIVAPSLMSGPNTSSFNLSNANGVFLTTTGAVTIGPGAVTVSGATTFSAASTALTVINGTLLNTLTVGGASVFNSNVTVTGPALGLAATHFTLDSTSQLSSAYTGTNAFAGNLTVGGTLGVTGTTTTAAINSTTITASGTITANGSPGLSTTTANITNVVTTGVDTNNSSTILGIGGTNATVIDIGNSATTAINIGEINCAIAFGTATSTVCTFPGALHLAAVASTPADPPTGFVGLFFNSGSNKLCFVDSVGGVHTITST